jgi:hypothetical protein
MCAGLVSPFLTSQPEEKVEGRRKIDQEAFVKKTLFCRLEN